MMSNIKWSEAGFFGATQAWEVRSSYRNAGQHRIEPAVGVASGALEF